MSELGDRIIMTIVIVGIAVPILGWVVGGYIELLPPWYPRIVLPLVFLAFVVVLAIVAWEWLGLVERD